MLERILRFSYALREAGVPLAVSETMDATRALAAVPLDERASVKAALSTTLIKSPSHRPAFDTLFDIYFSAEELPVRDAAADDAPPDPDEFLDALYDALSSGDAQGLGALARAAVEAFGRIEDSPSGSVYFEYPVFRALDLDALLRRFEDEATGSAIDRRIAMDAFAERVRAFRTKVRSVVRGKVAALRGPEQVARYSVRPLLEDIDLATATADDLEDLRRAVYPLARKLATRLALRHRKGRKGRLDVRRTIRHSLSTGGVPFDDFYRRRAPHRPELMVLCDVSDSVARFARFSLMLVHALQAQFARVRSFAFIDTVDEVTHLFGNEDFGAAVDRLAVEADVVWLDRNSNYGTALERFLDRYGDEVGPKTTLLILGDARSNNRAPKEWALKELDRRAHRTYWLNPESITYWDTGDSIASLYAAETDGMSEARTVRQLKEFIATAL